MKYVKVMDGLKSNANGFVYKIGEVNVVDNWNPSSMKGEEMGGFNFSTEDKVLRWIHRGDTIYDVEIPDDAEVIEVDSPSCPRGVFRSNKIIIKNPRKITKEMLIDLYKKSDLPEETYYICLVVLLYRYQVDVAKYIIKDRINKDNVDAAIRKFEDYISQGKDFSYDNLWDEAKEIYNILIDKKNNS